MRTITLSNNKGGSAKTTTTVSLAAAFAETGLRVLVIDLDPQGSATLWLDGRESAIGLVELAAGRVRVAQLVQKSSAPGVDLIPTSRSLVPSGDKTANDTGVALLRGFARLPDYWDLILVDTPPAVGYLSLAPLVASDHVVIPAEVHALALPGVASVAASIQRAREQVGASTSWASSPAGSMPRSTRGRYSPSCGQRSAPRCWTRRSASRSGLRRRRAGGCRSPGTRHWAPQPRTTGLSPASCLPGWEARLPSCDPRGRIPPGDQPAVPWTVGQASPPGTPAAGRRRPRGGTPTPRTRTWSG
jgi:hypothetical protein